LGLSTDRKARVGEALAAHLRGEIEKWGPIIKAAGIKGE
jgi:tripartite-type tricarboxylate transporter receptor subunit TctC